MKSFFKLFLATSLITFVGGVLTSSVFCMEGEESSINNKTITYYSNYKLNDLEAKDRCSVDFSEGTIWVPLSAVILSGVADNAKIDKACNGFLESYNERTDASTAGINSTIIYKDGNENPVPYIKIYGNDGAETDLFGFAKKTYEASLNEQGEIIVNKLNVVKADIKFAEAIGLNPGKYACLPLKIKK